MAILDTKHKRKSAAITTLLVSLLVFVVFNFGMNYIDPPEEYGLAVNLGDLNVGFGEPVIDSEQNPIPNEEKKTIDKVEEEVKESSKEVIQEKIISDETSKEVMVVQKKEIKTAPVKEVVKKEVQKEEPKKPSKEAQDALNSLLNANSTNGKQKGEGDDTKDGVKGNEKGDPNSSKYYGNTGVDGGNYNLSGRKALEKPIEQPDCQEEGTVVVRIEVDKNGKVINATPGVKGSTNTAECLLKPAKEAALRTVWNADSNAPAKQIGTIIYKFTLSK
ncbi:MAG: energy transducer TonB [Cryomorphaceae bacterium BACL22 MAG-120619-bin32]|jgi:periplasmic protein TonB|nr:MAG: energy transducer TonB [Cryomorphaceae bacterium BACL22 MAG-120619-bin32]